jgi:hypothetical protein
MALETKGDEHQELIRNELDKHGYRFKEVWFRWLELVFML